MKTIEECVVTSMDGSDTDLFPFLPYILQDLWEIGADPEVIIQLIYKHFETYSDLKVLDLGCGKGAVSVKLSKKFGCRCYGIDAIDEFIDIARQKAIEYNVGHLNTFNTDDIRSKVKKLSGYDIVILGAIGPVFGDYYTSLTTLSTCLNKDGVFIIDDGYIDDCSTFAHPQMYKKKIILGQILEAGMKLIDEEIMDKNEIKTSDDYIFENIEKRCIELIKKYPEKQCIFKKYIQNQKVENDILENKVIGSTMVISHSQRKIRNHFA